jgi:hypothetical protein
MSSRPARATLRPGGTRPGDRRRGRVSRLVFEPGRLHARGLHGLPDQSLTDVHALVVDPLPAPPGAGRELAGTLGARTGDSLVVWPLAEWLPVWGDRGTAAEVAPVLAEQLGVSVSRKPWREDGPVTWWRPATRPAWWGRWTVRAGVVLPGLLLVAAVLTGAVDRDSALPEQLTLAAGAACLLLAVVVLAQWLLGASRGGSVQLHEPLRPAPAIATTRRFRRSALLSLHPDEVVLRGGGHDEVVLGGPADGLGVARIQPGPGRRGAAEVPGVQLLDRQGRVLAALDRELWFGTDAAWRALADRARAVGIDVRGDPLAGPVPLQNTAADVVDRSRGWLKDAALAGPELAQAVAVPVVVAALALGAGWTLPAVLAGSAAALLAGPALVRVLRDKVWLDRPVPPETAR